MNIFNKVAFQSLKKNHTRTIVTIIGVVLSSAMITAVATFGTSLLNYMTEGAMKKYGDWHAAFLNADSSFIQEQKTDEEVTDTTVFENIGYAKLDNGKNPDKPYLFIAGFGQHTFDSLPVTLLSGRLPENDRELLVSGKVTSDAGVSYGVGDTLTFAVGDRMNGNGKLSQSNPYTSGNEVFLEREEKTYTVVGICQTPVFEKDSAPGYTLITKSDGAGAVGDYSLFVTLKNPRRVYSYAAAAGHEYILNNDVLRFMGLSKDASDRIFNAFLYSAVCIVIAIIMIGSIFLIYNSFSISLNERTQQIGILASVGATARQLRNSVLFEGICIGAVGIPIGILTGLGSIGLVISAVARNFGNILYTGIPLTMHFSWLAIAGAAAVSIITILISAYIPARKAAGTPVMECIRQTNEVKVESRAVKTSSLAQRIYGLEGTLALKNFKRNKKRYRSIVLSLVLSIVLFISASALVEDMKQLSGQAKVVTDYDIGFGTQDMDDGEMLKLYDQMKSVKGISKSSYQVLLNASCTVKTDALSDAYWEEAGGYQAAETVNLPLGIQIIDDDAYIEIVKKLGLSAEEYTGQSQKMIAVAKMQVSSEEAKGVKELPDMFKDSSMNVGLASGTDSGGNMVQGQNADLAFTEFVPPDTPPMLGTTGQQPYFFRALVPWSLKDNFISSEYVPDITVKGMGFRSENPSQSTAEMEKIIQGAGITSAYILLNTSKVLEESQNYIFIANVFSYTFIIMISLIAAANVFNTISTNIKLRRQELAMLRSVGMSERNFNKMMRFECAFYGIRALIIGLPASVLTAWLIHKVMVESGIQFKLPWSSIGISVLCVLLVIFATMMYATGKIKKENIIDALRDDMS